MIFHVTTSFITFIGSQITLGTCRMQLLINKIVKQIKTYKIVRIAHLNLYLIVIIPVSKQNAVSISAKITINYYDSQLFCLCYVPRHLMP